MKEAVINVYKKGKQKEVIGFEWKQEQQDAFDRMKEAIQHNIVVGGDPRKRYYLSVVADKCGFGAVLFQLMAEDDARRMQQKPSPKERNGLPNSYPRCF